MTTGQTGVASAPQQQLKRNRNLGGQIWQGF
jgi:hypothetical protein